MLPSVAITRRRRHYKCVEGLDANGPPHHTVSRSLAMRREAMMMLFVRMARSASQAVRTVRAGLR